MRIESGTTTEYRIRTLIFLGMVIVFAAWFGYDGYWGYPQKNLDFARQHISPKPDELHVNPQMTKKNLKTLVDQMKLRQPPVADSRTRRPELWYIGPIVDVIRGVDAGKLTAILGEPAMVHDASYWFVGPAVYAQFELRDGEVYRFQAVENPEKSEASILGQKVIAAVCLFIAIFVGIRFMSVAMRRTVLDDEGLHAKGHHVGWDQMTGLDTSDFRRKGWLDLRYEVNGSPARVRLDSYHIARFDEIINTICERKGFELPLRTGTETGVSSEEMPPDLDSD